MMNGVNKSGRTSRTVLPVALAALLLAGCTPTTEHVTNDIRADSTGSALADWRPTSPLPLVTMPEHEKQALEEQRLQDLAEMLHITDPPAVRPARWIYPEEVGSVVAGCLREAGFDAAPAGDGRGFTADAGTQEQIPTLNLAWYRCSATYPPDPRTSHTAWNTEQQMVAYAYITDALIPCLEGIGANPIDAPSASVYLADPTSWEYPDPGDGRTMESWIRTCPPDPPSRAILGEG